MATTTLLTAEKLERAQDLPRHCELVRGELLELSPPGFEHGDLQVGVASRLRAWAERTGAGRVVTEVGFVLRRDPDTVRAPDVAFVRAERLPLARPAGYVEGAPDLAVEIRSPSDRRRRLSDVVADYLRAGCPRVWVIDPRAETLTVHRPGGDPVVLGRGDVVDGGDGMPGLRLTVAELVGQDMR